MISYCHSCGVHAALDDARMCDRCRDTWRPSAPAPADLGYTAARQARGKEAAT